MCGAGARGSASRRSGKPYPVLDRYLLNSRRRAANDNGWYSESFRFALVISGMALAGATAFVTFAVPL
ncbi:hypothetical protein Mnod_3985 [Methylobacterium nodulans ORS 2060]|uniref:Uncharacterized protein n=1 Tax=Methylobacterium nodulans (strain LMG 21967 / CNCM I-2342 / ORS 2060) TaxID=460265 RepID=B8ITF7_METNO|nr:hypothetical protein Mnod_3985 [Methylobacterium nodulans ORS 2060]